MFRPLGLEQTSLGAEDRGASNNLRAYILVNEERVDVTQAEYLIGSPAGGVVSTTEDVNDFYRGLLAGGLLSPSTLEEMKAVGSIEYGLGLTRWPDGCSSTGYLYGHVGGVYGYRTVSMASDDGDRQITLAMALPTLPAKVGDPVTSLRIERYGSQMELAARKALDQLCA
ncbi:MAG TPA: serine hydrolase [Arthrobacter sp.]|nr:serine hydrolase [Arthrobacter sp.]